MTGDASLSGSLLDELFPFHFTLGAGGLLGRVGPALSRICPEMGPGTTAADVLRLQRPAVPLDLGILRKHTRALVVVEAISRTLKLRGQFVPTVDGTALLFVGTPWITDLAEARSHGIALEDFPPHSAQAGSLFLMRSSQVAVQDARRLVHQLNSANLQLRAVLETAAEGIIIMRADGTVSSFNAAASRIFGYSNDEVLGRNVSMLMPPEVAGEHDGYVARYLDTGVKHVVGGTREVWGLHKDGHRLALELSVSDATVGEEHVFTGIIRDLQERRRFERNHAAQIRVGGALLRAQTISEIWSAVAGPVAHAFGFDVALFWLRSPDSGQLASAGTWTGEEGRFGAVTSAVREVRTSEGPIAEAWRHGRAARLHDLSGTAEPHHVAATGCGLRSAVVFPVLGDDMTHGAIELLCVEIQRPDPSLLGTLEAIGGSIGLALERALALRLAEESAKAREEFLAHMSHEIRTPLSAVIGLAHLLESAPLGDQERDTVARLSYSASVLRGLVNNVLDFAKLTAGQLELIPQSYPLARLLSDLTLSQEALAHQKGLTLTLDTDPALPSSVVTDYVRLTQVLMNLVGNAIKFTERGGVTLRVAPISLVEDWAEIQFSVLDTGPGVDPADRERIFEAYTQANEGGKERFLGGTGLGLAIVRRLVTLLGGSITVETAEGGGAAFHVVLPFRVGTEPLESTAVAEEVTDLTGLRILVVDDSEMNRFVASRILREAGAEVLTAEDGDEALVRLQDCRVDLVLMDLQMPRMDGFRATRAIREQLGPSAPPVVALTARATIEGRRRAAEAGMVDTITKPFRPAKLKHRVGDLARGGRAAESPAPQAQTAPTLALIDPATLMVQAMGDTRFAARVLEMFREEGRKILDEMEDQVSARDTQGLERLAHTLKSQAGTVGALSLQTALQGLESMLRNPTSAEPLRTLDLARDTIVLGRTVLEEAESLQRTLATEPL